MSAAAKVTLLGAVLFTASTIAAVHFTQKKERERMHLGVVRDEERQREKQVQREANARELAAQQALEAKFRAAQEELDKAIAANSSISGKDWPSSKGKEQMHQDQDRDPPQ